METRELIEKVYDLALKNFETEEIKPYFKEMIRTIPEYHFTMPSSTSGKYHNKKQCGKYGQIIHEFMQAAIVEHLLRLKHNKMLFATPIERDCIRCVPFFHDAIKCGWNGSRYTVAEHPILAATWVKNTKVEHDIPVKYKEMIAGMCEAHSGEWNKDRSGNVIMSEPRCPRECFVHECDILSSRADIDWILPQELSDLLGFTNNDASTSEENVENYKLPFGKYKGELLVNVVKEHRDYVEWMRDKMNMNEPLKTFVHQVLSE